MSDLLNFLRQLPPIRFIRRRRFEKVFRNETMTHLFDGVYADFASAAAAAPAARPAGYDHPNAAALYRDRLDRLFPEDQPVAAALTALAPLGPVLDFGGHIGLAYYAMRQLLGEQLVNVPWTVVDVPAVVQEGRALAHSRGAAITFATSLDDAEADVLLAAGALQYVEQDIAQLVGRMRRLPRAIVLHKTPLTDGVPYVTLNAIGVSFCPYAVRNRAETFDAVTALGYECRQTWRSEAFSCVPWDRPERAVHGYTGALFVRRDA